MNIITKTPIQTFLEWPVHLVATLIVVSAIIMMIIALKTKSSRTMEIFSGFAFFSLFLFLFSYAMCSIFLRVDTDRYTYTATLDDSYSVNELYEKYTNVTYDEETQIYTFDDR